MQALGIAIDITALEHHYAITQPVCPQYPMDQITLDLAWMDQESLTVLYSSLHRFAIRWKLLTKDPKVTLTVLGKARVRPSPSSFPYLLDISSTLSLS
jgi:hypothetical protein